MIAELPCIILSTKSDSSQLKMVVAALIKLYDGAYSSD